MQTAFQNLTTMSHFISCYRKIANNKVETQTRISVISKLKFEYFKVYFLISITITTSDISKFLQFRTRFDGPGRFASSSTYSEYYTHYEFRARYTCIRAVPWEVAGSHMRPRIWPCDQLFLFGRTVCDQLFWTLF